MEEKQTITSSDLKYELNRLWKSQAQMGKRACLFNLIIYTPDSRRAHYFKDIVTLIMEQFSCRIIFIQGDPYSEENYLRMRVFTQDSRESHLMGDQIFIEAGGEDVDRVSFLIFPLFVSDVPIYLLWGQDPTRKNLLLPKLQHFATRLIFDSETMDNLENFSRYILKQLASCPIPVVDMNWARIGGWREVLAQTFDSPERLEQLITAQEIKITYNKVLTDPFIHSETQAIYLQAWLASRLGWHFKNMKRTQEELTLYYQNSSTSPVIHLIPGEHHDFTSGELLEIEVSGLNDYSCRLKRQDHNQVEVRACNQFQCELPFTVIMPTLRLGRNFMQEVFYQEVSDHYRPMLELIHFSGAKHGRV